MNKEMSSAAELAPRIAYFGVSDRVDHRAFGGTDLGWIEETIRQSMIETRSLPIVGARIAEHFDALCAALVAHYRLLLTGSLDDPYIAETKKVIENSSRQAA